MKKAISVALASAMVMGLGVNAFADISYNTGAGTEEVDLEEVGLCFDGDLIIERDGEMYTSAELDDTEEDAEFRPGDVIYMPLYGDDQLEYDGNYTEGTEALPRVTKTYALTDTTSASYDPGNRYKVAGITDKDGNDVYYSYTDGKLYLETDGTEVTQLKYDGETRDIASFTLNEADAREDGTLTITLAAREATDAENGDDIVTDVGYGPYTGEIGKNWSINFIEKSENYVEKASFYKAKSADTDLDTGAWYVKVELKNLFDSVDEDEVYYKVYVSDNNNQNKTNQVYVKGTYANETIKYVDFEWTNNANTPAVWQVKKGENGTAVFDFQDKAFFTVKMYSEEKMYLDLNTAYQNAIANEYDAEFDSFYKFQGTNANFSRTGELVIESDDPNLFVYEIDEDGYLYPVDANYVEDYQITHTNDKINGYVFNTKTLGNYVLSEEELEVEEDYTEVPEEEEDNSSSSQETDVDKENPNTGANDFVGVAVAMAIVSMAGAGALALKK